VKRSLLTPVLLAFDLAETDRSAPVRFATTQPTQALGTLNGDFFNEQARFLAARIRRETGSSPSAQVRRALHRVTGRPPSEAEIARGVSLLESLTTGEGLNPDAAFDAFCLLALNLNEFLYLE
jgi:hypothetical protein